MVKDSKRSQSPTTSVTSKRKQSNASVPDSKRQRSMSTSTGEDATRKYCLSKLEEMFVEIFLRYPTLPEQEHQELAEGEEPKKKTQDELTPEEKETVEANAKRFTAELEHIVFDLYAEPDKHGKASAAGKYKYVLVSFLSGSMTDVTFVHRERFRMLQFNLSKPDRVNIHTRIASSEVTAHELATMSSTDLANDEIKQSIKQAEQESLAHSILKKTTLPTAKITHKGIQDIEDVNGTTRERSRDKEQEEDEERMERERLARLRLQAQRAKQSQDQHQEASGSVPPESPSVAQNPTWGGPPPLPSHAAHPHDPGPSPTSGRPPANPLFVPSASELVTTPIEGELNLDDLINIDDDPSSDISLSISIPPPPPPPPPSIKESSSSTEGQTPTPLSTTALSPFAAKPTPDSTPRPSFDLNALWTPREESSTIEQGQSLNAEEHPPTEDTKEKTPDVDMDIEDDAPEDQDFDMFLENHDDETIAQPEPINDSPEAQRAAFDALPVVWTGKVRSHSRGRDHHSHVFISDKRASRFITARRSILSSTSIRGQVPSC